MERQRAGHRDASVGAGPSGRRSATRRGSPAGAGRGAAPAVTSAPPSATGLAAGVTVGPGPDHRSVRGPGGRVVRAPDDWVLVEPGDAALTRRVKAAGDHWVMEERRGRRTFGLGVWAPEATVERIRHDLAAERSTEAWAKKQASAARRREREQTEYVDEFLTAVLAFLAFDDRHADRAGRLARAVTAHATPVGSGTVARTERIPVERRAEAAVIAWLRHQTTAYDSMQIPRVKGKRREVRRMLAERSRELLDRYRKGAPPPPGCPLAAALDRLADGPTA